MITLKYAETVDESVASNLEAELAQLDTDVHSEQIHLAGGKYNVIHWAFPALVTISITAPFVEGFIKKVGEGAGEVFNRLISKAYARLRGDKQRVHARSDLDKMERGANSQTLGHALPRISVTFEITGKKSGRTMNLPFIFLPDLTDEDVNGTTAALVANVTTLIQQQSNAIDGAHMEPLPLAYVFKTNRGWVTDWQLVQEMVQRQAKTKQQGQSKRRRSKRG